MNSGFLVALFIILNLDGLKDFVMCYGTRVIKKVEELENHYRINAIYGNLEKDTELIYNYANGFSHPIMWILPQEKRGHMIPVMWGLIPHYENGANAGEYYKRTLP